MKTVTVLYAEDDFLTRLEVKEAFEKRGWKVIEAADGEEAFKQYKLQIPDVIVLDLDMPCCSGFEFLQLVRISDMQTPVVIYSALKTDENVKDGLGCGANVYMIKDFTPSTLVMQVDKYINRNGDIFIFNNDVYYNTKNFTLYTPQGIRKLSMLESKVFSVLCRNQNRLTQRSLLLKAGWDEEGAVYDLQLNKIINKLRDILDFVGDFEIITEKGRGYWLKTK